MSVERLSIRPYGPGDLPVWEQWELETDFSPYITHTRPAILEREEDRPSTETLIWMVEVGDLTIGAAWLEDISQGRTRARLSILLGHPRWWDQGLGTEAVRKVCNYGIFHMGLVEIFLHVRELNKRAIRCFQKAGFVVDEVFPRRRFPDGSIQHSIRMKLVNLNRGQY